MRPTRTDPWPFGPKHLTGLAIAEWPLTHVASMLHLAQGFPDNVFAKRRPWVAVLAAEEGLRAAVADAAALETIPEAVDAPDPAEASLRSREGCWTVEEYAETLTHWLKDERVPAFVREMVREEWSAARYQASKRNTVVERDHLASMLARLRRAVPATLTTE